MKEEVTFCPIFAFLDMIWYHETMSLNERLHWEDKTPTLPQKTPEKSAKVPETSSADTLTVDQRWAKLENAGRELSVMRKSQKAQKEHQKEQTDADNELTAQERGENMWVWKPDTEKEIKPLAGPDTTTDKIKALEWEYWDEIRSLYKEEMELAGDDATKKDSINKKILSAYAEWIDLSRGERTPEKMKKLALDLPEAYKDLITNPEKDFGGNLNGVRESIYGELYHKEREIIAKGWTPEDIQKALADNFYEVTGIRMSPEEFSNMLKQQQDSEDPSQPDPKSKDFATVQPWPSPTGFMGGGSGYGASGGWGGGGWGGGEYAPSSGSSGGGGGSSPENLSSTPSEMTTATYAWQWSSFKMQWPLKDVTPDMTSPALLAKLAKQWVNPGGSTRTCYKSVKNHICAAWYIPTSYAMGWGSAKDAGPDLTAAGFQSVWTGGWQTGDVYVYSWGEHGHIEINTGDGFASDFFSPRASGRTLIGIYRPPQGQLKSNPHPQEVPQSMMG